MNWVFQRAFNFEALRLTLSVFLPKFFYCLLRLFLVKQALDEKKKKIESSRAEIPFRQRDRVPNQISTKKRFFSKIFLSFFYWPTFPMHPDETYFFRARETVWFSGFFFFVKKGWKRVNKNGRRVRGRWPKREKRESEQVKKRILSINLHTSRS